MRHPRFLLFVALFSAGLLTDAWAQSYLLRWTFNGDTATDLSVTTGFGDAVALSAALGPGETLGSVAAGHTGVSDGWAAAIHDYTAGDYFEFSLGVSPASAYAVDTITLYSGAYLNGATGWEVRSSVDGYSAVLGTGLTNQAGAGSLTNLGLELASGETFSFRVYGTGGVGTDVFNGFLVDDVTVSGSLTAASSPVPEPGSAGAWLGAVGLVGALGSRRRQRAVG